MNILKPVLNKIDRIVKAFRKSVSGLNLVLSIFSAGNLLSILVIHIYLTSILGAGKEMDAFFASTTLPQLLLLILTGTMHYAIIPIIAKNKTDYRTFSALFNFLFLIFGFISLLIWLFSDQIIYLINSGFDPATHDLTVKLLRIQVWSIAFAAINGFFIALHYAHNRFILAGIAPLAGTIINFILMVLTFSRLNIASAAVGKVADVLVQCLLLGNIFFKQYHFSSWNFDHPDINRILVRMTPLILGSAYNKTDALVDRFLASYLPMGTITYLGLANRFILAMVAIVVNGIVTPLFPKMVEIYQHKKQDYWSLIRRNMYVLSIILTLIGIIFLVIGKSWLNFLLDRKSFTEVDVTQVFRVMIAFGGLYFCSALGTITSNSYYALGDTKTPTIIWCAGYTVGIVLKWIGVKYFSFLGIAAATSVYMILNVALQLYYFKRLKIQGIKVG